MTLQRTIPLVPAPVVPAVEAGPQGVASAVLQQVVGELVTLARAPDHLQVIDLRSLPLDEAAADALRRVLGRGEVVIRVDSLATTLIEETAYPGVWWQTQGLFDAERQDFVPAGRLQAIVVATVPPLVRAPAADVQEAARRLALAAADPLEPADLPGPGGAHD